MIFNDRVKCRTVSVGTGSYQLGTAFAGFETFSSSFADGSETSYCVTDGDSYEVGHGTISNSGLTLSRDLIIRSSNSNALVDWTAGEKQAFCTLSSALVPTYSDVNPTVSENPIFLGAEFINTTTGTIWVCSDNTTDANVWMTSGMTSEQLESDTIALIIALG